MRAIIPYLIISILSIYIYSCANQGTPTGGPEDTIPPVLIESYPTHETINYKKQEFRFVFNEKISTDNLKSKLIITPYTENEYKVKFKKYEFTLIFEEPFKDSTTYTLNFADGVVDVTEKNPVENFSIAFSTGTYIDSISVSGKINNLYDNTNGEKMTVALYTATDTLDILTGNPQYFTTTDTSGYYQINNIKNTFYKIYAFEDANNNLKADTDTEKHGFISDTIDLNSSLEQIDIPIQLIDATELKYVRSKQTGSYFDIVYSKYIDSYDIVDLSNKLPIPKNNLVKENKTLRFYHDSNYNYDIDSLAIQVIAKDSIDNQTTDTTYIKFSASKRKKESFTMDIEPKDNNKIHEDHKLKFTFSKPITHINTDSILLTYDTLIIQKIPDSIYQWNSNRTELTIEHTASKTLLKNLTDSLLLTLIDTTETMVNMDKANTDSLLAQDSLAIDSLTLDSLATDTVAIDTAKMLAIKYLENIKTDKITYQIKEASFISIENDTSQAETRVYQFKNQEDFGKISGSVTTSHTSYILQLVNASYQVIASRNSVDLFTFEYVTPGKYTFRVLIDNNTDGVWKPGNIHKKIEPESIYFYPEQLDIRANWEIENINISF